MEQHQQTQKMEALRKLYGDVILNTTKEAAARIMVSDRKAFCFQQKLFSAKEEALGMLLRLKQVMDAKIADVEMRSLRQRLKIEELEAQLHEAEDVVIDLRAQLDHVQNKLENMKKAQETIFDEQAAASFAVSHENSCHAEVLRASEGFPLPLHDAGPGFKDSSFDEQKTGGKSCSTSKIATTPIESLGKFLVDTSCVGSPSIASKTMTTNEPVLDRNRCKATNEPEIDSKGCGTTNECEADRNRCMTTNELELDKNRCKTTNEPELDRNRCKAINEPEIDRNGCKTTNECEPDRNRCMTTNEPEFDKNGCKTTIEPEPDRSRCKTTDEPVSSRNGCTQRIQAVEQNILGETLSLSIEKDNQDLNINVRSTIREDKTADMSCDVPSPQKQNLRLMKKKLTGLVYPMGKDNSSRKVQSVNFIPRVSLRKSTSKYKKPIVVPSENQVIKACAASIPSKAKSCPGNSLAESGDDLSRKTEKEDHKNLELHMHPESSLAETNPKPLPQSMHDPGYKTETTVSVNIQKAAASDNVSVDMPDLSRQGGDVAGVPNCWQNYEAHDLTTDSASKDIKTCNTDETTIQVTDDRFLKYTFQRKRKKRTPSCSNETDSQEQNNVKKRAGEKQIGALQPSSLIIGTPRDTRHLVPVARQLISLSEESR